MGEWDLYFFVPCAAFPLITSEKSADTPLALEKPAILLWRSKQLFPCCSAAVGCEPCVELHYLSVNNATVRLSGQRPLLMDLGGSPDVAAERWVEQEKAKAQATSKHLISRLDRDHHDSSD